MELKILRTYLSAGTNGSLFHNGFLICRTIELPWRDNQRRISCIPEGKYRVMKRYSPKFGNHLELKDVENRNLILFHPANNARKELRGCIAPVTHIVGAGMGTMSLNAFEKLKEYVEDTLNNNEAVWLIITS
ncbi:DUF5675 family protein [Chryseobacterium formosus]|uniref:DUF5675 family protein n=1 Tax=Chryseobacterium formosus TaxID=1537363 RepID=A0ABT3XWB1_9FLAO|nr:DUF5675 family protein [Chryseobacterium formosus]MCX8525906.1 DUF5675 family protein [Chryseobacterium formosus]